MAKAVSAFVIRGLIRKGRLHLCGMMKSSSMRIFAKTSMKKDMRKDIVTAATQDTAVPEHRAVPAPAAATLQRLCMARMIARRSGHFADSETTILHGDSGVVALSAPIMR